MGNVLTFRANANMNVDAISYITSLSILTIESILKDYKLSSINSNPSDYRINWRQLQQLLNDNDVIQSGIKNIIITSIMNLILLPNFLFQIVIY